jgi:hypothetical protein
VLVENYFISAQGTGGVMTFRLGSLKQYWFIGLVVLWVVVAGVFLLIAPKPTVEQRAVSTEQPGASESAPPVALESGQPTVLAEDETLTAWVVEVLGVLDDICVGQASAVFELIKVNRDLDWMELFRHSLNIGRDHIAATVNTLLLAYMGASLPLMLVFTIYQEPFRQRINREPIAEEIVRTLVGSIGLVLAVPITGLIAGLLARWMVRRQMA